MVTARELARFKTSKEQLATAWKNIQIYAAGAEDKYPTTAADVFGAALTSPGDPNLKYVYVTGQGPSSPKTNILAYDPYLYGNPHVKTVVLLADGAVTDIYIGDVRKQLADQKAKPDEMPK